MEPKTDSIVIARSVFFNKANKSYHVILSTNKAKTIFRVSHGRLGSLTDEFFCSPRIAQNTYTSIANEQIEKSELYTPAQVCPECGREL